MRLPFLVCSRRPSGVCVSLHFWCVLGDHLVCVSNCWCVLGVHLVCVWIRVYMSRDTAARRRWGLEASCSVEAAARRSWRWGRDHLWSRSVEASCCAAVGGRRRLVLHLSLARAPSSSSPPPPHPSRGSPSAPSPVAGAGCLVSARLKTKQRRSRMVAQVLLVPDVDRARRAHGDVRRRRLARRGAIEQWRITTWCVFVYRCLSSPPRVTITMHTGLAERARQPDGGRRRAPAPVGRRRQRPLARRGRVAPPPQKRARARGVRRAIGAANCGALRRRALASAPEHHRPSVPRRSVTLLRSRVRCSPTCCCRCCCCCFCCCCCGCGCGC